MRALLVPLLAASILSATAEEPEEAPLRQLRALAVAVAEREGAAPRALAKRCDAVSLRLLPPPSYINYHKCFKAKLDDNSSHDWSVPGAKTDAEINCWCANDMTKTIEDYGCCNHRDLYPMCSIDCTPDCDSALAKDCLQKCPSMCFEAAEYVVDEGLCHGCSWEKCWPVLKCLTEHAKERVATSDLNRTCDETGFVDGPALENYRTCWRYAPKHSSHWNVMSSVVNCICREGMIQHTKDEHCCNSLLYGRGVCGLECMSEEECFSQDGQTCIQACQRKCAAFDVAPNQECMTDCLEFDAPCRKYASCPPPHVTSHICDDGRWPSASSGCCESNRTDGKEGTWLGCPRLCENQHIWRLDGGRAVPWWSRWQPGAGIIYQCTCEGCPESTLEGRGKLERTLEDSVWDNGQMMLIDIARREGLTHGPNRQMQELMVRRNEAVLAVVADDGDDGRIERTSAINEHYTLRITQAARLWGDDLKNAENIASGEAVRPEGKDSTVRFGVIAALCTLAIMLTICAATVCILKRRKQSPIMGFEQSQQVVIGNPVQDAQGQAVTGAPVTVAAVTRDSQKGGKIPTKTMKAVAEELS